MTFLSHSEEETVEFGRLLATRLTEPTVILLRGPLGAGKTALTRGLAAGLGLEDESLVHSPTFGLIHEYPVPSGFVIQHVDLYRLDSDRDFHSIGLEEMLDGEAYVIVEWAEKLRREPPGAVRVQLTILADESREIAVFGLPSGDA